MKILSDIEMREAAETYLQEKLDNADENEKLDYFSYMNFLNEVIKRTPDEKSFKKGSWQKVEYIGRARAEYKCPFCGYHVYDETHYCPGCGAFLFC